MGPNLSDVVLQADSDFREKCREMGVVPWDVDHNLHAPIMTGVSTNWPNKVDDELRTEAQGIMDAATLIASNYGIKAVYHGLHAAAGGSLVMYVGFVDPDMPDN